MEKSRVTYIYTLSNPFSKEVIYVGRTIRPAGRLCQHITTALVMKSPYPLYCAIRDYHLKGAEPILTIIEKCEGYPGVREYFWIDYYNAIGPTLLNKSENRSANRTSISKITKQQPPTPIQLIRLKRGRLSYAILLSVEGKPYMLFKDMRQASELTGISASTINQSIRCQNTRFTGGIFSQF